MHLHQRYTADYRKKRKTIPSNPKANPTVKKQRKAPARDHRRTLRLPWHSGSHRATSHPLKEILIMQFFNPETQNNRFC